MVKFLKNACVGCGKCTKICPVNIIKVEDGLAMIKENQDSKCLECGHCQGICPFKAILINDEIADLYDAVPNVSYEDLKVMIKTNRSIRHFKDELVPKEKIEDIIRTTNFTGSAKNQQPIKWIVISGKENVQKISDISVEFITKVKICPEVITSINTFRNPITVSAPHLLIAYANKDAILPAIDSIMKVTSAELLMHASGIGSCHLGYLINFINNSEELKNHLGLDKDDVVYGALGFGYYGKEIYPHIPARKKAEIKFI